MMLVVVMSLYYLISCLSTENSASILVTLPTFLVVIANVALSRNKYVSSIDMFWICAYLFFVIAPVQSIGIGGFLEGSPVYGVVFSDDDLIFAGLLPFTFFLGFSFATITRGSDFVVKSNYVFSRGSGIALFLVCVTFFGLYLQAAGGPAAIYTSRYDQVDLETEGPLATVYLAVFAVAGTMYFVYWRDYSRNVLTGFLAVFCIVLIVLAQNPFNAPRYYLLQYYLPIYFILAMGRVRRVAFFIASLAGILIVFPILSITSRFGKSLSEASSSVDLSGSFTRLQFMDVFDMTAYHLTYWQEPLYFGKKTLGAILFFIPRSIWEAKPPLTSIEIGTILRSLKFAGTSNLSFFVGDEFYSDFSFIGVFVGAVIVGLLFRYADTGRISTLMGHNLTRYFLISALPILMRGPIGANIGLIAVTLLSYFLLRSLLKPTQVSAPGDGARPGALKAPFLLTRRRGQRALARAPIDPRPRE